MLNNLGLFLVFLATASMASGQYVAVGFNDISSGAPTNLWVITTYQSTTNVTAPNVLFTVEGFNDYMATNMSSFYAWQTNAANPRAREAANIARIVELFNQIPVGRANMTNILNAAITNAAQASTQIKVLANVVDKILEELQRLGPVLKEIYKPESDAIQ